MRKVFTSFLFLALAHLAPAVEQSPHYASRLGTDQTHQQPLQARNSLEHRNAFPNARPMPSGSTVFRSPGTNIYPESIFMSGGGQALIPDLHGCVISRNDWTQSSKAIGLYTLPVSPGEDFILDIPGVNATQGGVPVNGVYYATNSYDFGTMIFVTISGYDLDSGNMVTTLNCQNPEAICFDATVDPTSDRVYALTYNSSRTAFQLSEITYKNPVEVRGIAVLDGYWNAIAADNTGTLYGIRKIMAESGETQVCTGSELVVFNKDNGSYSVIGETGHAPEYVSSATIDPDTNRMYWTVNNKEAEGYICEVSLSTGTATRIMDLPAQAEVTGLFVKPKGASPAAPAAPVNMVVSFPGGGLQGTVNFDIPATLVDGSPAQGNVKYRVTANDATIAEGEASYGDTVSESVSATATGNTEFAVILSNQEGDSPRATITYFVGKGVPETPSGIRATYSDGCMNIAWSAVTTSADGGYINPQEVTYTVTCSKDNETVAANTGETSAEHRIAEPEDLTRYYYTVTATYDGRTSAGGISNTITLGSAVPPYTASILTDDDMGAFTIIDGNQDGNTWSYNKESAYVISNNRLEADDWLISLPVILERGYVYYISTDVYGTPFTNERFELKIGRQPDAESMTETLVGPTDIIKTGQSKTYGSNFTPDVSGKYYIGLHAISPPLQFALYTTNISISKGEAADKPGAGILTATPDPDGAYRITLNMTAPDTDLSGNNVSTIIKSELYRDDVLIKTFEAPEAGSSWEYVDPIGKNGVFNYTFVSYTTGGKGTPASTTGYSGTDKPAKVSDANIRETQPGHVEISWNAVNTDHNGHNINPANVTYSIYTLTEDGEVAEAVIENISATKHTFRVCEPDAEQRFVQYALAAYTEGGASAITTEMIPLGKTYQGMEESFTNTTASYLFGTNSFGTTAIWSLADDMTFLNVRSYDHDNGYIYLSAGYTNEQAEFFTGKISLEGMKNPTLKFYIYPGGENDTNILSVKVREPGHEYTTLLSEEICNLRTSDGWSQVIVPLSDFEGKTIQLAIHAVAVSIPYVIIDKIAVESMTDHDLKLSGISAPTSVTSGYGFDIDVTVTNKGLLTCGPYSLELYADGMLAAKASGESIIPEGKVTHHLNHIMERFATEDIVYTAKVIYDLDEVPGNNTSGEIRISPCEPAFPAVSGLHGSVSSSGNKLWWTEPDLYSPDRTITETFEDATAWSGALDEWIFIDADKAPAGGVSGTPIPGVIPGQTPTSFFVFDYTEGDWGPTFKPVSGNKFIATLFRDDNGVIDDWAVSPELTGEAQTITFWAKSYRDSYPEKIEIYYSTGGTAISDFKLIEGSIVEKVPAEWTQYSVNLPAGAVRFAIRSCAQASFILMMDDFEFVAAGIYKGLEISGYDIYRDHIKANDALCTMCSWTDTHSEPGQKHKYTVIPVYNKGEGKSSHVTVDPSSTTSIEDDVKIKVRGRDIIISGAAGKHISVSDTAGNIIFTSTGNDNTVIPVAPGIYLVRADAEVTKLIVM